MYLQYPHYGGKADHRGLRCRNHHEVTFPAENRLERAENVKDVASYIERIDEMIDRKEKLLSKLV